jgi:hypothetical protein
MMPGKGLDLRFEEAFGDELASVSYKPLQKHEMFPFFAGKFSIDRTHSGRLGGRPGRMCLTQVLRGGLPGCLWFSQLGS